MLQLRDDGVRAFDAMNTISTLFNNLSRRTAIWDAVAALAVFFAAFIGWLFLVSRITLIDFDSNDLLILGAYALIFFVAFVVAPLMQAAGRPRPIHYSDAVFGPIRWEFELWRRKGKRWFFGDYELRKIIDENDDSLIKHNLSLIYRNLLLSLPAYGLHSISTIFYYRDQAVQISVVTATIILILLFDVARRAKRIYVILSKQVALYDQRGPRSGPNGTADRWLPLEEQALADHAGNPVVEKNTEFASAEFDALLDDETREVLTRIRARSKEDVLSGLKKTGVLTEDGKLTKKYGGTH